MTAIPPAYIPNVGETVLGVVDGHVFGIGACPVRLCEDCEGIEWVQ